jgi:tripartite-type tricarboxylate transporter receptor subunit TctC
MGPRLSFLAGLALVAAAGLVPGAASAQFYKGKTITMIINYPAGGPNDIEGRIVAQHLPNHIPGKPTVVVKNVSGGGGIIGTNALGDSAPNGETIGFFTPDVVAELLNNPALKTHYADFVMLAGVENPLVVYARKDTPPGLKVAADIMKAKDFKALSLNAQSSNSITMGLSLELLGIKYQPVPAYRGLKEVETAILQNIGQMANTSLPGWTGSAEPALRDVVIPLWQVAPRGKDGGFPRSPALPNMQTFEEFYASVNGGKPPSGKLHEVMRTVCDPLAAMFRAAMMPPKSSSETIGIMRAAFAALANDPDFIADYTRIVKSRPILRNGGEVQEIVAALAQVKPETKAFIVEFSNKLVR